LTGDGPVPEGYSLREEALVHASSRVSPQARLVGPLVVGPGVTVEDNVTLVGPTAIGSGSHVARGAVVSRSVLWSNCRLGTESLVDRCLVSDDALVPPRTNLYGALKTGPAQPPARSHGGSWAFSRLWARAALPIGAADAAQRP
jgi:NDP-sugar pyrophosphorylase family protein